MKENLGKLKWGAFATENWGEKQKENKSFSEEVRQSCERAGARRAARVQRAPGERKGRTSGEDSRWARRPAYAPEAAMTRGAILTPGSLRAWGLVHGVGAGGVPGRGAGGDAGSAQH